MERLIGLDKSRHRHNCKVNKGDGGKFWYAHCWYTSYDDFVVHRCMTPYRRGQKFGKIFRPLPPAHWQRPRSRMCVVTYFGEYLC